MISRRVCTREHLALKQCAMSHVAMAKRWEREREMKRRENDWETHKYSSCIVFGGDIFVNNKRKSRFNSSWSLKKEEKNSKREVSLLFFELYFALASINRSHLGNIGIPFKFIIVPFSLPLYLILIHNSLGQRLNFCRIKCALCSALLLFLRDEISLFHLFFYFIFKISFIVLFYDMNVCAFLL